MILLKISFQCCIDTTSFTVLALHKKVPSFFYCTALNSLYD